MPDSAFQLSGLQSALDPAGPNAASIARLSWIMFIGGGIIFAGVMALLAFSLLSSTDRRRWLSDQRAVVIGGLAFPVVLLSILLVYGLAVGTLVTALPSGNALHASVIGEQFWWRVRYRIDELDTVETANEIHVPAGRPVVVSLTTADVIHSFWIPSLAGKLDMIPGTVNRLVLRAGKPGIYRGQCAEFCGSAHAMMAFDVVVHGEDTFDAWLQAQAQPAREPFVPFVAKGRDLFLSSGCGACHTVRGTPAAGVLGPDLTHAGSRRRIAASSFPNNAGTLAAWISDSQHLKPDNRMPSFDVFSGEELRAVAAYVESLK